MLVCSGMQSEGSEQKVKFNPKCVGLVKLQEEFCVHWWSFLLIRRTDSVITELAFKVFVI